MYGSRRQSPAAPRPLLDVSVATPMTRTPAGWSPLALSAILVGLFFVSTQKFGLGTDETFGRVDDRQAAAQMEGGSASRRAGFLVLGLLGTIGLAAAAPLPVEAQRPLAALMAAYVGWIALSVVWSTAPMISLRRLILFACFILGASGIARQTTPRDLIRIALFGSLFCLLLGVAAEIANGTFQPWRGAYRFSGTMQPNSQGMNCSILAFSAIAAWIESDRKRSRYLVIAAIAALFLFLTRSRGAAGSAMAAGMVTAVVSGRSSRNFAILSLGAWFLGLMLIIFGDSVFSSAGDVAQLGREDSDATTLTGRLPLWTCLAGYAAERPLLGYGYGGFWIPAHVDEIIRDQGWVATSAHSAYLESLLETGFPGLAAYVLVLMAGLVAAVRRYRDSSHPAWGLAAALILFCLFQGSVESAMAVQPQLPSYLVFLALFHLALRPAAEASVARTPAFEITRRFAPSTSRLAWNR